MKIQNIKINNYGNLKQKEIYLKNNINIIYGKNETGKSTLLNYLKNIFYGISKNKNGKELSDYEKYLPWTGEEFSGKIKYELNNKKIFEIYRDFYKKNPIIFNENLEDISQEFKIDKKDGNQFFYEQTGIDEKTYISTIMSLQQEVVLDSQSQNILIQKLANLAGTGDDKVSYQKAIDRLNKKLIEEVGTARTQDRPLNVIQNRLTILSNDMKTRKETTKNKEILEEEHINLEQKLEQEEQKNNNLNKLNILFNKYLVELEKNNLKNKINNENKEKIKNKIEEKDNLTKNNLKNTEQNNLNKKINYYKYLFIFILLIIFNIFNFIFVKNKILNYCILSLIPIEIIIFTINYLKNRKMNNQIKIKNLKNKKIQDELKEKITIIDSQINLLEENIKKLQKEIDEEKQKIILNFNLEKEKILNNEIDFKLEEKDKLEKEIEYSNKKIVEYKLKLNSVEHEENNINNKLEEYISKEEEYENLQEQLNELQEKNKCILVTKSLLEKAYEKMKCNVTPRFTQNLSNIAKTISNGKYKKVVFNQEKGLIVELENGDYIPANRLSIGTIDELYLSLRFSMLDEISEEKMPVILDEAFAYFDDERLKNCLIFLNEKSEEHQIIILTCSNREKQILDSLNIQYNLVEL